MIAMRRERSGFAFEAREPFRILRGGFGQHFDCDFTAEVVVSRPIHLPHAPDTNLGTDGVRAETCARRERHDWGRFYAIDLRSKRGGVRGLPPVSELLPERDPALFRRFPEGAIYARQRQGATICQIQICGVVDGEAVRGRQLGEF